MLRLIGFTMALLVLAGAAQAGPIHDAAAANDPDAILKLIQSGTPADELNEAGETALIVAAKMAQADAVNALVHNKADPNFVDPSGRTALQWVVLNKEGPPVVGIIRFLYEKLADMNARDADGATALILAAEAGYGLTVSILMSDLGVDPEVADNAGKTALTHAGLKGYKVIATVLLRLGAKCQEGIEGWSDACEARRTELGLK